LAKMFGLAKERGSKSPKTTPFFGHDILCVFFRRWNLDREDMII
jgi:hypothetical protein